MGVIFRNLLDSTLSEIVRREPAYLERFPVGSLDVAAMAVKYAKHPLCAKLPSGVLEEALGEGWNYFARSRPNPEQKADADDPVTQFLCDSIVDALCADQGGLELLPSSEGKQSISEILAQFYSEKQTAAGLRYFIRNEGNKPLLLINSAAVAIDVWRNFLADSHHDFRIIVPDRRGADLFTGGLRQYVDIHAESTDLAAILESESIEEADVVAWCNGARLAIDLAIRPSPRISSVVLVTPTFKGLTGAALASSRFEQDIQMLFDRAIKNPEVAPFCSKAISHQAEPPDWNRLAHRGSERARTLFELAAREHTCGILAPLTEPASFVNMARRVASDDNHPTGQALGQFRGRTMVIMGSHDHIVSNALTAWAIEQCRNSVVVATLMGGGHYIHDLQYHYFRLLLTWFLDGRPFSGAARISVREVRQ